MYYKLSCHNAAAADDDDDDDDDDDNPHETGGEWMDMHK